MGMEPVHSKVSLQVAMHQYTTKINVGMVGMIKHALDTTNMYDYSTIKVIKKTTMMTSVSPSSGPDGSAG